MVLTNSVERRCPVCLIIFHRNKINQKYCSSKCKIQYNNKKAREKYSPKEKKILERKKCQYCDNYFIPKQPKQKFCSKGCCNTFWKIKNREIYKGTNTRINILKKLKCKNCAMSFKQITSNQKFCSKKCLNEFHAYKKSKKQKLIISKCKNCNSVFNKKNERHIFCSNDCQITYNTNYYKLRFEVMKRDNFTCKYCGRNQLEDGIKIHVDHIVPRSKGGENIKENYVVACEECNLGKSDFLLEKHQEEKYLRYARASKTPKKLSEKEATTQ